MSKLNITERRLPQDGRIKIKINNQELDLRVSIIPTIFGESVQIRILSSSFFLELENLGLSEKDLELIEKVIRKSHGIIFVSGPTGSGKSTTLYAALARINSNEVKIITIEDPVEYQLRGINQIQINPQINFTFATALRHMLRHDPDVMMIGEVRDYETAEIAIRSALTGHLVFSTLHTNDASGVVTRLLDMGIEPFLVSSSLECLIAQRLVRKICPKCKDEVSKDKAKEITQYAKDFAFEFLGVTLYEGKGCESCRFTGYLGRTAIYEILNVDESIRELILNRASSQQIKQKAVSCGMRLLRQHGMQKVLSGITTFTEVMRVTQEEAGCIGSTS
jgi:type II secretory ATPase GspE/PulE/Tfp pilus assembly ATPase PilB-like protein